MPNQSLANKKKWKVQQPDGSVVSFWGPKDMPYDKVGEAAGYQAELDKTKKESQKYELADKYLPQTNQGMGKLAAGFSSFMNEPLLPEAQSGEQYFNQAPPASGALEATGQFLGGAGRDLYNKVVRPFSSPTGIAGTIAGGIAPRLAGAAFGGSMAPGAAMDIGEFAQDPSMEMALPAMESTGATMLGLGAAGIPRPKPVPVVEPRIAKPSVGPALPPAEVPPILGMGGVQGEVMSQPPIPQAREIPFVQRTYGEGRINPQLKVQRPPQKLLPASPIEKQITRGDGVAEKLAIQGPNKPEPVMGEKFAEERGSRNERLSPEVLEESKSQVTDEQINKLQEGASKELIKEPPKTPEPFTPKVPQKGEALEGFDNVTYEGEGMGGELYKYGGKEGNNFSTKRGASNQEFLDAYYKARSGYESRIANQSKTQQPATEQALPSEPTPTSSKAEVATPTSETPGTFEPKTIGEYTIEATGKPGLPYQLRHGDTIIAKGLKESSFDSYLKNEQDLQAKLKAIDEKYRDVDEEVSDVPKGFQEEVVDYPEPTQAERQAMRVEKPTSREVKRPIKKKESERGSFSLKPREEGEISDLTKKRQDLMTPALDVVASLGKPGKELARLTTRARLIGEHYAGTWESRAKDALTDISDEEFGHVTKDNKVLRGNVIDVLEGVASPRNEKIAIAAQQIKDLLDETGTKAEISGMSLRSGNKNVPFEKRANYFPHLYTEQFWTRIKKDTQFREKILERIVKQNPSLTMDQAAATLKRARQFGERLIDPQHERVFNLPGWERTKGALMKHLHDMGRQIGNAEEVGPKDIAGLKLDRLIKGTKDPDYAYELMKRIMKRDEPAPIRDVKIANKITGAASWAYLSRASIGNLAQLTRVPAHASFTSAAKAFGRYLFSRDKFYREGLNSGAIVEIGAKGLMEEFGSKSKAYKTYGIEQSEKFLRSIASAAGRSEAELMFRKLKKDSSNKRAITQLEDLLQEPIDNVLKQEKLTERQSSIAGGRMAELTQGRAEAMDLPKDWSRSPYANLYFLYKKYALQDTRNMWKAIKKNPVKALATIAVLNQAAGEIVGDVKESLKGLGKGLIEGDIKENISKKVSERGTYLNKDNPELGRFFDNYLQSWTFGVLSDALQNIKKGEFAGTIGEMAGDIVTTAVSSGKKIAEDKEEPLKPLAKTATQMIPVLGPGIREGLFPKEEPKRKGPPRRVMHRPSHASR